MTASMKVLRSGFSFAAARSVSSAGGLGVGEGVGEGVGVTGCLQLYKMGVVSEQTSPKRQVPLPVGSKAFGTHGWPMPPGGGDGGAAGTPQRPPAPGTPDVMQLRPRQQLDPPWMLGL